MTTNMDKFPTVNIHTFGYGNSLDVNTLRTISKFGSGYFNYISDAGMVGTVFSYLDIIHERYVVIHIT